MNVGSELSTTRPERLIIDSNEPKSSHLRDVVHLGVFVCTGQNSAICNRTAMRH